jgi:hypothetical protein
MSGSAARRSSVRRVVAGVVAVALLASLAVAAGVGGAPPSGATPTAAAAPAAGADDASVRTPGPDGCTVRFPDVPCEYGFYEEIELLARDAIALGFPDGNYGPTLAMSRQAVAAFFHRAAGEPVAPTGGWPDPGFTDVPPTHAFYDEIAWFAAHGYATGFNDGTFRPTMAVSRQTVAAWVYRYAGSPTETLPDPGFTDVPPGHVFEFEIAWAAANDITTGYPDGTFRPATPITRQTLAAFLRRLLDMRSSCEPLDDRHCFLPFPSDNFTKSTLATDTGRELELDPDAMPDNNEGVKIDPTDWERQDGFSPGNSILVHAPGVDLDETGFTRITDQSTYGAADNPVVVIDTSTGERHPVWAELDVRPEDDADRLLMIWPTVNWKEGHHYVVGLRGLVDAAGDPIAPDDTFVAYRDGEPTGTAEGEVRRGRMERTFQTLETAGVDRSELYLAWDFTVASERNLSERFLHMRDDAYVQLDGDAPPFTITSTEHDDEHSVTEVRGTFDVPSYTIGTGVDLRLNYGSDGLPERNGSYTAEFGCVVPDDASPSNLAHLSLWQHGLLGTYESAINDPREAANEANTVFCGVNWIGMSTEDLPTVAGILLDLSHFAALPDRGQQGILNTQLLAYLMKHVDGFASSPTFQEGGLPIIDTSEVGFIGGSQGGIMGVAATATSKEWEEALLAVPGTNYSFLLHRSVHWANLVEPVINTSYPEPIEQPIGLAFIQLLWDRAEANGYAQHLVDDTYAGTPDHDVILFEAFGDHQVANMATETLARTAGVPLRAPALTPGRSNLTVPFWGIDVIPAFPHDGSALVVWDWGSPPDYDTAAPPLTNSPPGDDDDEIDPHGRAADEPLVFLLATTFMQGGGVIDVCGGAPCVSP